MFNFLFNKFKKYTYSDTMKNTMLDIDQNICSIESNTNMCIYYDMGSKICKIDYMDDFMNYELCNNIKTTLSIIINNNVLDIRKYNTKTYYNKTLDHYYYEYNNNFYFNEINGYIEFIIKKNDIILATIKFNYTLNKPTFDNDIIKIRCNKNIIFLFLRRKSFEDQFYIYKIIYTNII